MANDKEEAEDASNMATEESQDASPTGPSEPLPLYLQYPMSSSWEFTLTNDEKVQGEVYCTDPISQVVVLQDQLNDIRMISAASIRESKLLKEASDDPIPEPTNTVHAKKALEEREKKAIKLAQESFRHINPKASPIGQNVFDRLLKACNEVVWKGESIIVLNQIQVDPPYAKDDCKLLRPNANGAGGSLDRVQKIVAAANASQ